MPGYIVTLKASATPEDIAAAKQHAIDQGGKVVHDYTVFKGFSVEMPPDVVSTLESIPHVEAVEADSTVTTQ